MRSSLDCIPCFMRQALEAARQITQDETQIASALRRVLLAASEFDLALSPPEMGQQIHRILRQEIGSSDPYRRIKEHSTRMALDLAASVRQQVEQADEPFETAVRFAIAGNIMDFALVSAWDDAHINASFEKARHHPVDAAMIKRLQYDLDRAETVLILGDNAGETVFDRVLIEHLPKHLHVTYAVKGAPVINDATLTDARQAGLDEVAELLSNGTDAPGTVLRQCSDDFMRCFNSADVVIAKGQANFETLNTAAREIYFLTQIKCPVIAQHYGYRTGDWIVTTTSELGEAAAFASGEN